MYRGIIFNSMSLEHTFISWNTQYNIMNMTNNDTNAAVRSKDIRQTAIRRYLNYHMAVKARESLVVKRENNVNFSDHELKDK